MSDIPDTLNGRIEWLKDKNNRDPIKRRGAGSIYYRGNLSNIESIEVIVSTRSNNVGSGLAHFGGLGEDEDLVENDEVRTGILNALREGREEMEELLGYQPELKEEDYSFLYAARDDKFFINNGKGFPVDARLHMCRASDDLWNELFPDGAKISGRSPDHNGFEETEKAEVLTFKQALMRQKDYHYPHEYFSLLVMAAKHIDIDVIDLICDVNKDMYPKRIDFTKLAEDMFVSVEKLENYLGSDYLGKLQSYEGKNIQKPKSNSGFTL